ncbi:hypothetical protein MRX96_024312 [Rhipicephalus microplus]
MGLSATIRKMCLGVFHAAHAAAKWSGARWCPAYVGFNSPWRQNDEAASRRYCGHTPNVGTWICSRSSCGLFDGVICDDKKDVSSGVFHAAHAAAKWSGARWCPAYVGFNSPWWQNDEAASRRYCGHTPQRRHVDLQQEQLWLV